MNTLSIMKTLAILLAASLVQIPAFAQNRWIKTPEGEITLQQTKCPNGGKEAVYIDRSFDGGSYGCWEEKGGQVIIRWHTLMGANGSMLKTDKVDRYPSK